MALTFFPEHSFAKAGQALNICTSLQKRLVTAESCTGGLLSGIFTSIPGSAAAFECGFVTYSNRAKTRLINVPSKLIEQYGAVSKEVAIAMAEGALQCSEADIAIAVTGVAGPGGSEEKPVGLVYVAVAMNGSPTIVNKYNFLGNRQEVRMSTVDAAIDMLLTVFQDTIIYS